MVSLVSSSMHIPVCEKREGWDCMGIYEAQIASTSEMVLGYNFSSKIYQFALLCVRPR